MSNRMAGPILQDDFEIDAIFTRDANECFEVGDDGVTKIEAYAEWESPNCRIWFAIWEGRCLRRRISMESVLEVWHVLPKDQP